MMKDKLILAKDQYYSLDCYETQLNNNVLVVGAAGTGKTRSIVSPNILQATGSYIISDPKGNLYKKYKDYLEGKGYKTLKLDFTNPTNSMKYNPFAYIRSSQDIVKMGHMLARAANDAGGNISVNGDLFWVEAATILMTSLIAYLHYHRPKHEQTLENVFKLISACDVNEMDSSIKGCLDRIFEEVGNRDNKDFAYQQYQKFRVGAGKTLRSILITLTARLGNLDFPELKTLLSKDEIQIQKIGLEKTALFVIVSDKDRSLDSLANIFFTQAMDELCRVADHECEDERLPVPVRFILDDFATNCTIDDFPRMISSIRSRGISTMLMLQTESQLTQCYGYDGRTIMGNCDTYLYLGGNDIETAQAVAMRCDQPVTKILNMPVGKVWVFRRGQAPIQSENFDLVSFEEKMRQESEPER